MRRFQRKWLMLPCVAAIFGLGLLACNGQTPPGKDVAIEIKQVTYADLDAKVKEQKGKVVVIDVWFRG